MRLWASLLATFGTSSRTFTRLCTTDLALLIRLSGGEGCSSVGLPSKRPKISTMMPWWLDRERSVRLRCNKMLWRRQAVRIGPVLGMVEEEAEINPDNL